ncbi:MAG: hypothetical protein ABI744_08330 [Chloroflexota bacterium]
MSEPHDTVVVTGGGNSAGTILLALVVLIVVLAAGWYFLMGPGATQNGKPNDINVQVQIPTALP